MKYSGIAICGVAGGAGASVGYFLPDTVATGFGVGALALVLGAADFVIRDSLKLVDGRIDQELQKPRTAFRRVISLDCTRRSLLRLSLVAMCCKGLAVAMGALATQGKAQPVILAAGCGALVFGAILTGVILISHEQLVTKAHEEALDRAESASAKAAVDRLGNINAPLDTPERPVLDSGPEVRPSSGKKRIRNS